MKTISELRAKKIKEAVTTALVTAAIILVFIAVSAFETRIIGLPEDEGYKDTAVHETASGNEAVSVISEPDYWYVQSIAEPEAEQPVEIAVESVEEAAYESIGEYTLTAYCLCVKCCGIWSADHPSRAGTDYVQRTASGTIPKAGRTIGANPGVLPFGTVVLINGAEYVVEDTGSAAGKNAKLIDIYFGSHESAIIFGKQKAEIYIKNE